MALSFEDRVNKVLAKYHEERQLREQGVLPSLAEKAEAAMILRSTPPYELLRQDRWHRLVEFFVRWLELDPTSAQAERELRSMHYQATAIYNELFRPEEILKEYAESRRAKGHHVGKKIDLASKPARIMPEKMDQKKYYPTVCVSDIEKDSPLMQGKVGETFTAKATFRRTGVSQRSNGGAHVDLEIHSIEL